MDREDRRRVKFAEPTEPSPRPRSDQVADPWELQMQTGGKQEKPLRGVWGACRFMPQCGYYRRKDLEEGGEIERKSQTESDAESESAPRWRRGWTRLFLEQCRSPVLVTRMVMMAMLVVVIVVLGVGTWYATARTYNKAIDNLSERLKEEVLERVQDRFMVYLHNNRARSLGLSSVIETMLVIDNATLYSEPQMESRVRPLAWVTFQPNQLTLSAVTYFQTDGLSVSFQSDPVPACIYSNATIPTLNATAVLYYQAVDNATGAPLMPAALVPPLSYRDVGGPDLGAIARGEQEVAWSIGITQGNPTFYAASGARAPAALPALAGAAGSAAGGRATDSMGGVGGAAGTAATPAAAAAVAAALGGGAGGASGTVASGAAAARAATAGRGPVVGFSLISATTEFLSSFLTDLDVYSSTIYIATRAGEVVASSSQTTNVRNDTAAGAGGTSLLKATDVSDPVIAATARFLRDNYATSALARDELHLKGVRLAGRKCYVNTKPIQLDNLDMYVVIVLPRRSIMAQVDRDSHTMLLILTAVSVGVLLLGWAVIIFLTFYVSGKMRPKEELLKQQEKTQRAQAASEVKSQFLANISHDLRTPMAGILGLLDIMLCDRLTAEQEANLRQMKSCAASLLGLLNNLLDLAKVEAGKMQLEVLEFDIVGELESLIDMFSVQGLSNGTELALELADDMERTVKGDPSRVRQVFANLLSNACKFTKQGHVLVRAWMKRNPPAHLALQSGSSPELSELSSGGRRQDRDRDSSSKGYKWAQESGEVAAQEGARKRLVTLVFEVDDTGPGIPAHKRDVIFENFQQADVTINRTHGGTGLGLGIVRSLVRLMGGDIAVTNKEGPGACFRFELVFECVEEGSSWKNQLGPSFLMPKASTVEGGQVLLAMDEMSAGAEIATGWMERRGLNIWRVTDWDDILPAASSMAGHRGADLGGPLVGFSAPITQGGGANAGRRGKSGPLCAFSGPLAHGGGPGGEAGGGGTGRPAMLQGIRSGKLTNARRSLEEPWATGSSGLLHDEAPPGGAAGSPSGGGGASSSALSLAIIDVGLIPNQAQFVAEELHIFRARLQSQGVVVAWLVEHNTSAETRRALRRSGCAVATKPLYSSRMAPLLALATARRGIPRTTSDLDATDYRGGLGGGGLGGGGGGGLGGGGGGGDDGGRLHAHAPAGGNPLGVMAWHDTGSVLELPGPVDDSQEAAGGGYTSASDAEANTPGMHSPPLTPSVFGSPTDGAPTPHHNYDAGPSPSPSPAVAALFGSHLAGAAPGGSHLASPVPLSAKAASSFTSDNVDSPTTVSESKDLVSPLPNPVQVAAYRRKNEGPPLSRSAGAAAAGSAASGPRAAGRARSQKLAKQKAGEPNYDGALKGLHILIAEDTALLKKVAIIRMQKLGCTVEAVSDGQEALDAVVATYRAQEDGKDTPRPFSAVLMDCQMPNMDGYASTAAIRALERGTARHTPIVALTAHAMTSDERKCLDAGMDAYLTKPIDPALMAATLARLTGLAAPEPEAA